jgi:hypothetical protein
MATYTVTRVRKELSSDKTHLHIEGVCTDANVHWMRKEVVDSIRAGHTWKTSAGGYSATIEVIAHCPQAHCLAMPYIKTKPDTTLKDNLENLDTC